MKFRSVLAASILLLGCRKDIQNQEAVRQGVIDHLAKRSDLSSMDVRVDAVSFRKDEADATVYIQPKSGGPGGMRMRYVLERKDNRWVVKSRPGMGASANPHSGQDAIPALPPGHPQIPQSARPQP